MEILYLGIVFLIIIIILWMKKPLFLAISGGIIATILLFRVPFLDALKVLGQQLSLIHILFLIFLARPLYGAKVISNQSLPTQAER